MSSGQRRWAAAPGGICAKRDPRNRDQAPSARSWDAIARSVIEAAQEASTVAPISRTRAPVPGARAAEASSGRS
jgi:hypothetical protein